MISYPGDIVARFGRYEAVDDLGSRGRAHLWRAWDPFVERFVVVAVLADVAAADVLRGWRHFEAALEEWTGSYATSIDEVLDFAPPDAAPAFLVLRWVTAADSDAPTLPAPPEGGDAGPTGTAASSGGVGRGMVGALTALVAGMRSRG